MPATLYRPGPPLRDFVDCLWHWDGYPAPAPLERALPSGTLDVTINLVQDRLRVFAPDERTPLPAFPGIMITGARAGYTVIATAPGMIVMGVHFKPGGAFPFLGVPAGDLMNTHAGLDVLWGARAAALRERLIEAATSGARFRILETFLLDRVQRPLERDPIVAEALRAFDEPSLRSVTDVNVRTGASPRLLIARFREQVGLTPKAFWRVRRFQAALRQLERPLGLRGAALAAELGYFDQAHFIREFHQFAGLSPGEYLEQEVARPNHVPLRGQKYPILESVAAPRSSHAESSRHHRNPRRRDASRGIHPS
jgi:AraC-like DNA-binding protein